MPSLPWEKTVWHTGFRRLADHACKGNHLCSKIRLTLNFRGINGIGLGEVILGKIVFDHTPAVSIFAIAKTDAMKHSVKASCLINGFIKQVWASSQIGIRTEIAVGL
jgi:hypothetical protein